MRTAHNHEAVVYHLPNVGMKPLSERDENYNRGLRTNPETVKM